jgi:hypothetical protein
MPTQNRCTRVLIPGPDALTCMHAHKFGLVSGVLEGLGPKPRRSNRIYVRACMCERVARSHTATNTCTHVTMPSVNAVTNPE